MDFIITDLSYRPLLVIEINDQTHRLPERRERDKKVACICEEAGIPLIRLWTSYGVNEEYIKKKITQTLDSLPVERIHHFVPAQEETAQPVPGAPLPEASAAASSGHAVPEQPQPLSAKMHRQSPKRKAAISQPASMAPMTALRSGSFAVSETNILRKLLPDVSLSDYTMPSAQSWSAALEKILPFMSSGDTFLTP